MMVDHEVIAAEATPSDASDRTIACLRSLAALGGCGSDVEGMEGMCAYGYRG